MGPVQCCTTSRSPDHPDSQSLFLTGYRFTGYERLVNAVATLALGTVQGQVRVMQERLAVHGARAFRNRYPHAHTDALASTGRCQTRLFPEPQPRVTSTGKKGSALCAIPLSEEVLAPFREGHSYPTGAEKCSSNNESLRSVWRSSRQPLRTLRLCRVCGWRRYIGTGCPPAHEAASSSEWKTSNCGAAREPLPP
jgi:hypothetical protein